MRRWLVPVLIGVLYLVAGVANAGPLLGAGRPTTAGTLTSTAYLAAWLVWALVAGCSDSCRAVRGMAGLWAVMIAVAAICSTFVRLDARSGVAASGWMVTALLVLAAAPLYGLTAAFAGEPLVVLMAVTVAAGALTVGIAGTTRWLAGATS
ncbi:MAG TPA: hypothetical protein VGK53_09545 [Propionicimonas sp.]